MVFARGFVACLILAGMLGAQTPGRARRSASSSSSDVPVTAGCPSANTPPVAVAYSATAADYVELRRTDCVGGCAAYTVRVYGDGRVSWAGEKNVVAVGPAAGAMDAIGAKALIQEAVSRGFWGLCASYRKGGAEMPSYVTTVQVGGQVRRVEDRGNVAPGWLRSVDAEIDELTDSHRWRHGEASRETFGLNRADEDARWPKVGVTRLMKVSVVGTAGELRDMLADTSLDVNAVDSSGWTALMYASQAGTVQAMQMLIGDRADVVRVSNEGETTMHAAVSGAPSAADGPGQKVRVLWALGVDINGGDSRGVTPLMLAARRFEVPGLIATMMELGADPAKRDVDGKTALDYMDGTGKAQTFAQEYADAKKLMLGGRRSGR